jgi:repressor LexA
MASERAQQVLHFVKCYKLQHGVAPSYREIGAACGINSTSQVSLHLKQLEQDGYIKRLKGVPRGIVVMAEAKAEAKAKGFLTSASAFASQGGGQ